MRDYDGADGICRADEWRPQETWTGDSCGWGRSVGGSWSASYEQSGRRRELGVMCKCGGGEVIRELLQAEDVKQRAKRWFGTPACAVLASARDLVWGKRSFRLEVARRRPLLHPTARDSSRGTCAVLTSATLLYPLLTHFVTTPKQPDVRFSIE